MLEVVRLFVVMIFFGYAAFSDYKTMTTKNWVFAAPFTVGLVLAVVEGWSYPIIEVLIQCVCYYVVWRLGGWGGGDAKGLMSLAILIPHGIFNNVCWFPLISLWIASLLVSVQLVYMMTRKKSLKNLQVPLLTYLIFGIVAAQLTGQQLITLIWR